MSKLNTLAGLGAALGIASAPMAAYAVPGPAAVPALQGAAVSPGAEVAEDLVRIESLTSRGLVDKPQISKGGREAYLQAIERSRVEARVRCGDALHPHWALQVEDSSGQNRLSDEGLPLASIQPIIDTDGRSTGVNLVTLDANQGSQILNLKCEMDPPLAAASANANDGEQPGIDNETITIRVDTTSTGQAGLAAPGTVMVSPASRPGPAEHDYSWVDKQKAEEAKQTTGPNLRLNAFGTFPDLGLNAGAEYNITPDYPYANFGAGAGVLVAQRHETVDKLHIPGGERDIESTVMGVRGVGSWNPQLGTEILRGRVAVAVAAIKALETMVAGQHVSGDWSAQGELELGVRLGNDGMGVTVGGVGTASSADAGQSINAFLMLDKKL